ncbi:hypothetical protein SDJN03_21617, partial [Cucurbita argyrosperma subsp. sororia]
MTLLTSYTSENIESDLRTVQNSRNRGVDLVEAHASQELEATYHVQVIGLAEAGRIKAHAGWQVLDRVWMSPDHAASWSRLHLSRTLTDWAATDERAGLHLRSEIPT